MKKPVSPPLSVFWLRSISPHYAWLVDRKLVGFEPWTQLEPWYFLSDQSLWEFESTKHDYVIPAADSPQVRQNRLVQFAKKQDDDLAACIEWDGTSIVSVWTINLQSSVAFDVLEKHVDIFDWLKSVIRELGFYIEAAR